MSAYERYASTAARWQAQGRPDGMLAAGYPLIALRCWTWSAGAEVDA